MRALVAAVALAVAAPPARAEAPPLADVVKKVDAAKAGVETLSGEFTQKNRVKLFKQELTSKGRFYFRKPRQIRWEYTAPDPSALILDGNQATLHDAGRGAAGVRPRQGRDHARDLRSAADLARSGLAGGGARRLRSVDGRQRRGADADADAEAGQRRSRKAFSRIELRLDRQDAGS